jgi:hypothetical protein
VRHHRSAVAMWVGHHARLEQGEVRIVPSVQREFRIASSATR